MSASQASNDAVWIFDTTLRDGEQSPGCSMNLSEKLTLARQLQRLGVDVIEAGFPIASDGDFEAVKAIAEEVRGTIICGLSRTGREDVDRALQALEPAAKPRVHVFIATSDIHLEHKLRMDRDEVLQEVDRAVRRAREYVDDVEFSAEDATRSDWEYLAMVFDTAIAAGASTINVPDTVGYTMPEEYTRLMEHLAANVPGVNKVRMSAHCHNDLGLGVANSLAAVFAGARQIECTVNGIGERAGNTAMEEVVMALKTRPDVARGLETHINTEEIYPTSRLLSSIIGVSVQPNKAIVGQNAFAHEAGIHQHGVLQAAITYEIMTPQSIGRPSNELVLGKHSGRHAFRNRLAELGIDSETIEFEESFKRFKDLADKKKIVYNEDIEAIVADSVSRTDDRFEFSQLTVLTGTFAVPNATVELIVDGEPKKATAGGVGPVDAVFKAVSELTDTKADLVRYQVNAITAGLDAQGDVSVTISEDGRKVIGHGAHYDVLVASAKAYVHALNKLEWHKQRHTVAEPKGI